jgi:hypothetical protein
MSVELTEHRRDVARLHVRLGLYEDPTADPVRGSDLE